MGEVAPHARRVVFAAEPALHFGQAPVAQPTGGVDRQGMDIRLVGVVPLSGCDELLGLEEAREPRRGARQRAHRERRCEGTLCTPHAEQDAIAQRVTQRRPLAEGGAKRPRHIAQVDRHGRIAHRQLAGEEEAAGAA